MSLPDPLPAVNGDENMSLFEARGRKPLWEDRRGYVRWSANFCHQTWLTVTSSYVNLLLVLVPLGIVAGALSWNPTTIFWLNFFAIIPLAALLTFVNGELAAKLSPMWRGLLDAIFVNAVKLCTSIVALKYNEIRMVQSSMLGSILSNILLTLGCCFVAGGFRHKELNFNSTLASTLSSLMVVASVCLILPAALYATLPDFMSDFEDNITTLSRDTSVVMLVLYALYLYFQLKSHATLFKELRQAEDMEQRHPCQTLSPVTAAMAVAVIILLVAVCANFMIGSVNSSIKTMHISKTFVGLVLLPMLGNATERISAVVSAYRGRMDLAIEVIIGGSMQIALFITPFLVIVSWSIHTTDPMTLFFHEFETIIFFLSVLVVKSLLEDGKSNYLEGAMCLGTYIIIAIAFRLLPDQ